MTDWSFFILFYMNQKKAYLYFWKIYLILLNFFVSLKEKYN